MRRCRRSTAAVTALIVRRCRHRIFIFPLVMASAEVDVHVSGIALSRAGLRAISSAHHRQRGLALLGARTRTGSALEQLVVGLATVPKVWCR